MREQDQAFKILGQCLLDLDTEYASSHQEKTDTQNAKFALGITNILLEHAEILKYASAIAKKDLYDSVTTHHHKYTEILQKNNSTTDAGQLHDNCETLKQTLSNSVTDSTDNQDAEKNILKELCSLVVQKCRGLFSEQSFAGNSIDRLQAAAIAFNFYNLNLQNQLQLFERLQLVKELWQFELGKHFNTDSVRFKLHLNLPGFVQTFKSQDLVGAFDEFLDAILNREQVLTELSNKMLVQLYDRVKHNNLNIPQFKNLAHRVHQEAQFRYNYNRLGDSGYELLTRFQTYDAILQQIENAEAAIVESFLLKNSDCTLEFLLAAGKNIDNIKAVKANATVAFQSILQQIQLKIADPADAASERIRTMLQDIKSKASTPLDIQITKRYNELDEFCRNTLREKYEAFCNNANALIKRDDGYQQFVQQVITRKIANDYYVANTSNAITKLRQIAVEKLHIATQLNNINFTQLFDSANTNNITNLNFKNQLVKFEIKNPVDYIRAILELIVSSSSAMQLEALYRSVAQEQTTNEIRQAMRDILKAQVKKRTSITKTICSFFTGRSQELQLLKNLQQMTTEQKPLQHQLQDIKQVPNQVRHDIAEIVQKETAPQEEDQNK